jgi:hypothetical protein
MSIRKIVDWALAQASGDLLGTIASPFYQLYTDANSWVWACDVDIGQPEVLRGVPVAANNREIIYAEQGKAVALQRTGDNKWVIAGLAKSSRGLGHIIYMSFADDIATVVRDGWLGQITRPLTYGELGSLTGGGYGALPYGAQGRFAPDGSLIEILGG